MFNFQDKKLRKEFRINVDETNKEAYRIEVEKLDRDDIVECDTCGCLIFKGNAIEKKFIVEEEELASSGLWLGTCKGEKLKKEVCETKYFCKKCGKKYLKKDK